MLDSIRRSVLNSDSELNSELFLGSRCDRRRSCDDDKACLNGGICIGNSVDTKPICGKGLKKEICTIEDPPNYHCQCKTGFSGKWCEKTNACHPMKVCMK